MAANTFFSSNESIELATFPEFNSFTAKALFDESQKNKSNRQPTAAENTASEFDSEAKTFYDFSFQDSADTLSDVDSGFLELSAISDDCLEGGPTVENFKVWHGDTEYNRKDSDVIYKDGPGNISYHGRLPKGSQYVVAYASPVRDGRRIRTSCDRNDDTGLWYIEHDGFIDEDKRVGGPYLCSDPIRVAEIDRDDPLQQIMGDYHIAKGIISILTKANINPTSMRLRRCQSVHEPEDETLPTLIFDATRLTFDGKWLQACRELSKLLSNTNNGEINVEIRDPALYPDNYTWPNFEADQFQVGDRSLAGLRYEIYGKIDRGGVGYYNFECISSSDEKDKGQLVYHVSVDYRAKRDWRNSREVVIKALDEANLPMVGVLFTKMRTDPIRLTLG